mgnify:CR=1 FL=1
MHFKKSYKTITTLLSICLALFAPALGLAANEDVDVYLLLGQSNMYGGSELKETYESKPVDERIGYTYFVGTRNNIPPDYIAGLLQSEGLLSLAPLDFGKRVRYGAELDFGRAIYRYVRDVEKKRPNIAILKFAVGSSSLENDWVGGEARLAQKLTEKIAAFREIIAPRGNARFRGIIVYQGESDAATNLYAAAYLRNLNTLINRIRDELGSPNLPALITRIHINNEGRFTCEIRKSQTEFVLRDRRASIVNVDHLAKNEDNPHYPQSEYRRLGTIYGRMMPELSLRGESQELSEAEIQLQVSKVPCR